MAANVECGSQNSQRKLIIIRHAERMDYAFGDSWLDICFDQEGKYTAKNDNMPPSVPHRIGGPDSFYSDTPITVEGQKLANYTGERLKKNSIKISHVYSSPALRCVQTAENILKGSDLNIKIHIEPGQFELLSLYGNIPDFMTPQELIVAGYSIDICHEPIWPTSNYNADESREEMYHRHEVTIQEIIDKHKHEGGNILIVGHAASLDTCIRKLLKKGPVTEAEFYKSLCSPYCGVASICEIETGKWQEIKLHL